MSNFSEGALDNFAEADIRSTVQIFDSRSDESPKIAGLAPGLTGKKHEGMKDGKDKRSQTRNKD